MEKEHSEEKEGSTTKRPVHLVVQETGDKAMTWNRMVGSRGWSLHLGSEGVRGEGPSGPSQLCHFVIRWIISAHILEVQLSPSFFSHALSVSPLGSVF